MGSPNFIIGRFKRYGGVGSIGASDPSSMNNQCNPSCRLCGSNEYVLVSNQVSKAPESAVYRCKACDLVYLFPIMTEEEETGFYQAEFEKYMEGRSGPGWKSPEAQFLTYQPEGERRLKLVRTHVKPGDELLEIGSSTGFFLDDMRNLVKSVTGVEPSPPYRDYANHRGIETHPSLESLGKKTFDIIFLYYVIEHLRDPIQYLTQLRNRLKKGGRVIAEVPNVNDVLLYPYTIPSFGPFYWQKAHYHYFSTKTFNDVLTRAGYNLEMKPVQRYDLSNHLVWMMKGQPGGMGA